MSNFKKESSSNLEKMGVTPKDACGEASKVRFNTSNRAIEKVLIGFSMALIIFGFLMDTPSNIVAGIGRIIADPDYLVTDYIGVGGMGAAFVNAGILTLMATLALDRMKALKFQGMTIAAILTFSGFSLFGKNIVNVWPIILGVFLYSKYKKECFSKHVYVALFGTAISPILTSIAISESYPLAVGIALASLVGATIGFFFAPLAGELVRYHQGFDLYNIGFVSGMIGTIVVFISGTYGFVQEPRLIWTSGNNISLGIFVYLICTSLIGIGLLLEGREAIEGYKRILKTSGRLFGYGYVEREGFAATLLNIGITGAFVTTIVLVIGGDLNGPVFAGIFTVMGFCAMGKNTKNIIPIIIGVMLGALTKTMDLTEPPIVLAILFGTGLAPVTGEFGNRMGLLAGFLHSAIVLNVGFMNGGFNLYNNGFSIGLVTGFLLPIMETIKNYQVIRLGDPQHALMMEELDKTLNPPKQELLEKRADTYLGGLDMEEAVN